MYILFGNGVVVFINKQRENKLNSARPKKRKGNRAKLIVLGLIALMVCYTAISIYQQQEKEMARLMAEAEELNLQLEAEIRQGKNAAELNAIVGSAQYIERLARDKLGLVSPEEIIFIQR